MLTVIELRLGVLAPADCWGPSQVFKLVEDALFVGSRPGGGEPAPSSNSADQVLCVICIP